MAVDRLLENFTNRAKGDSFEKRYRRMTTYIEKDLYNELQALRESRKIVNVTAFINKCLKEEIEALEKN